jgi:ABC-type bacteriocin/lantibiotic exporter with double-glycine peptidase domain
MEKTDKKIVIDDFIDELNQINKDNKKVIIPEKTGIIERIDKIIVTEDGRQLLREQY